MDVDTNLSGYDQLYNDMEKLRIQNVMFRSIFEDNYEGIVIVDADGHIVMINQYYSELLEVDPNECIGKHVTDVIENTRLHIVIKTGKMEIEQVQKIKDNVAVTARIPINDNGNIIGAVGKVMYRDVSEVGSLFKKLQAELNIYKERYRREQGGYLALENIIGDNAKILELKETVRKISGSDSTVLITGDSGTGKEVFANAIHETSDRRNKPFIKINCAAIPRNILESELFGYEDGAFTGARQGGKVGKFELAHMGTIFLDEIGDMSFGMQAKILRVLQEKEIERIGGSSTRKIDVRIIAATNQKLHDKIKKEEFRLDLFYRLNVINLDLPSLKDRIDDIPLLCNFFIDKYNEKFGIYIDKIDDEAMSIMKNYSWPGNIRELENVIERAYNFVDGTTICKRNLPAKILNNDAKSQSGSSLKQILDEVERETILRVLKSTNGNKSKAAEILGINRASLYQKLNKNINYFTKTK